MTTGVLVMAYGTPRGPEEVEGYYTRIRHGRPPSPEQLADLERRYRAIGGSSPLAERTTAQTAGLARRLEADQPGEFTVRQGTKYASPSIEEGAAALAAEGCRRVLGLVLAPHESSLSTAQYFARARAALDGSAEFVEIGAWWSDPGFVELMADRVRDALADLSASARTSAEVVFSAHSLPARVAAGEDYEHQLAESARLVAERVGLAVHGLAFQSAGRTEEPWLGPDIRDVVTEAARRGVGHVVSCPIGFVADHLEVLYDLDIEAAAVAAEAGVGFSRTASLNDDPRFIEVLAGLVERAA